MGKSVPYVFLALSIAFFLFLLGLTGYRIETVRRANAAAASGSSGELLATAKALRDVNGSFESPYFKAKMRDTFIAEPRLLVLTLYTAEDGIVYLIARNKTYVLEPADSLTGWRGKPKYRSSPGFETLFPLAFPLVTPEGESTVYMDSLFVVFGREDVYPILRDDLYLLLSFLIVCGIFILIAANLQDGGSRTAPAGGGGGSAGSGAPWAGAASGDAAISHGPSGTVPSGAAPAAAPVQRQETGSTDAPPHASAERFEARLKSEIERASSSEEDISAALIEIDGPPAERLPASCTEAVERTLKEVFPLHDLIFHSGERAFAVIIPDSDIDRTVKILEELRARVARNRVVGRKLTLSIGTSARGGRLIDGKALLQEARVSVQKALREGGNRVMGFRASPSKYRQALSGVS